MMMIWAQEAHDALTQGWNKPIQIEYMFIHKNKKNPAVVKYRNDLFLAQMALVRGDCNNTNYWKDLYTIYSKTDIFASLETLVAIINANSHWLLWERPVTCWFGKGKWSPWLIIAYSE